MIKKLQRHLTLLFTATTGAILTLVLTIALFYQSQLKLSQSSALFQNQLLDFVQTYIAGSLNATIVMADLL